MIVKYLLVHVLVERIFTQSLFSVCLQRLTDRSDSSSDIDRMGKPVCFGLGRFYDIVDVADGNSRTFYHSTSALCMASVTDGHVRMLF